MTGSPHALPNPPAVLDRAVDTATLAQLTTLRVGGPVSQYVQTQTEQELIEVIAYADLHSIPLLVLGGGSNIVASDDGFAGIVVRDARTGVREDLIDSCGGGSVTVPAGANWDEFVRHALTQEWVGVESLIGIPGTVGAAPVQNIGAYGQEISSVVASVRVYDREAQRPRMFALFELEFAYRDSLLKRSMSQPKADGSTWGPSPRYIVLEVSFQFRLGTLSAPIAYGELARKLGVEVGTRANINAVAQAVLELRAGKDMLLDPYVFGAGQGEPAAEPTYNRWSAGSFFTNPILAAGSKLPEGAPTYPVHTAVPAATTGPSNGTIDPAVVKTSAAWLIERAGFTKGYAVHGPDSKASLSSVHTLALTNRGEASAADIAELARTVRAGVAAKYGITLVPEPVLVGITL